MDLSKITWTEVQSSNISAIAYDTDTATATATATLLIRFIGRGSSADSVYSYAKVPVEVWTEFKDSESKGKYFHAHIRPEYETKKLA